MSTRDLSWLRWTALALGAASLVPACTGCVADDRFAALSARLNCGDAGGDAGTDADSGPPPACIPSLANAPVDDTCGIFVSASLGDDANAGNTKSAPVKTLKQALLLGAQQNLPVYACAEEFVNGSGESLNVRAGSVLFGGLDCTGDWSYAGGSKKSVVQGAPDVFAAVLRTGSGTTRIEDFVFRAPDATVDGGSSIAVLSEPILNVVLARCDLIAGNGKDGAKGLTPIENIGPSDPNDAAIKGGNGEKASADLSMPNPGGAGAVNALCSSAVGGKGGDGFVDHGGDGGDGLPMGVLGTHGTGEPAMGSWTCAANGNAQAGNNGTPGTQGESAKDNELGTLDLNGFVSAAGKPGTDGAPGQGGGGARALRRARPALTAQAEAEAALV